MRIQQKEIPEKLVVLFLALAAINVFLLENYLVALAFLLFLFQRGRIRMDISAVVLVMMVVTYMLFYGIHSGFGSVAIFRIALVLAAYLIGYGIHPGADFTSVKKMFVTLTCAMAAHSIINLIYNIAAGGTGIFYTGRTADFWSGSVSSATGQAAYYFLSAGSLGYIVCGRGDGKLRIFLAAVFVIAFVHNLLLGGRTFLVLSAVSLLVGVVYTLFLSQRKRAVLKVAAIVLMVAAVVYVLYMQDVFGVRTMFESNYFYYRFVFQDSFTLETGRTYQRNFYLQNMWKYLFGGNQIRQAYGGDYAHDLWLDIYDDAGVLPWIFLLIYTVQTVVRCVKFVRFHRKENDSLMVLCMFVTLMLSFMTEPIMAGCPMVMVCFCVFDGMIAKRLESGTNVG